MKYCLFNEQISLVLHMFKEDEVGDLFSFFEKYKYLENTLNVAQMVTICRKEMSHFILDDYKKIELTAAYRQAKYYFTKYIIFYRLYIDNTKYFARSLQSDLPINKFDDEFEQKLSKVLRDFANHSSIPVKNATRAISYSQESDIFSIMISKNDLLKGISNRKSLKFIETLPEEVVLNDFFEIWNGNFNRLYDLVFEFFFKSLEETEINVIYNNVEQFSYRVNYAYPNSIRPKSTWKMESNKFITFDPVIFQQFLDRFKKDIIKT